MSHNGIFIITTFALFEKYNKLTINPNHVNNYKGNIFIHMNQYKVERAAGDLNLDMNVSFIHILDIK